MIAINFWLHTESGLNLKYHARYSTVSFYKKGISTYVNTYLSNGHFEMNGLSSLSNPLLLIKHNECTYYVVF